MLTPENLRPRSATVESAITAALLSTGDIPKARKIVAYIEPPSLDLTERIKYESVLIRDLPQDFDYSLPLSDPVVIGEHRDDTSLWYYVENVDGPAHRYEASAFSKAFPLSVSEYKRRKKIGVSFDFDPSASNVHLDSRPKTVLRVSLQKPGKRDGLARRRPLSVESLSDEEWKSDVAKGDDFPDRSDDDDVWSATSTLPAWRNLRRSTVNRGRKHTDLPFSPRKMRLRVRTLGKSENRETSILHGAGPARRSNRIRTSLKTLGGDHDYEDGESGSLSDEEISPGRDFQSKSEPIIPRRGRASRAAYGHIRSIADLEYDELEHGPLSAHRSTCERCQRKPTHILLEQQRRQSKRGKAKRKSIDEFEDDSDSEDKLASLGGWIRCLKCPLATHWRCLAGTQRDKILNAVQARDLMALEAAHGKDVVGTGSISVDNSKSQDRLIPMPPKRSGLESHQTTEFICSFCSKGGTCMGCKDVALEPEPFGTQKVEEHTSPPGLMVVIGTDPAVPEGMTSFSERNPATGTQRPEATVSSRELLFRCRLCKRLSHYAHLPLPDVMTGNKGEEANSEVIAKYYQRDQGWSCADCVSFVFRAEKILAWRPDPPNAQQPELPPSESISSKIHLPREYLVKWQDRSYRRVQWVPHGWLTSVHAGLLRNFLNHGPKVELLDYAVREDQVANAASEGGIGGANKESEDSRFKSEGHSERIALTAIPDAERRIPPAWKTVDRVLDVLMWSPRKQRSKTSKRKVGKERTSSVGVDTTSDLDAQREWNEAFHLGEEPSTQNTMTIDEWEAQKEDDLSFDDISHVVWAFIKWDDLGYDEATWDSPPRAEEPGHPAFKIAFRCFLDSRGVHIKHRNKKQIEAFENRRKNDFRQRYALKQDRQPDLGQQNQLKLMSFQIDGFNWLCDNWWNHQPCILADEMGLGKTVQIVTFIGNIIKLFDAAPILVVVPNSTITNWVREFSSWVPGIRVVPFYGEAKSREVIKRYELMHSTKIEGTTGAKYHVLVTTYDIITSKDFNMVIKSVPRWEVLIVDEGQRLKNDHSLLFKKLNELKVSHRVIMTGTPLNNNIRELFNLMNFLDPNEWGDLKQLAKEHEELTEDLVKELHNRLRPYFLRRLKGQVLQLPPKNEVIVPVSLTPLQKEVYKSVLGKNIEILKTLTSTSNDSSNPSKKPRTSSMSNILMDLRKCIQHPYLVSHEIEPQGLSPPEAHSRLVAGSAKLRLLQALLPKLKAREHRVLLFSQFVIALDIIEDFLEGEGFKYLRLDGNTKQSERQKGMDEFNRPGSDVFIYLLSTRAGGVGINLWSADTVIIFDPDFNPHQDLQAIARAHRYGQTKPCLVLKLMAKDTAEERIIQAGKKKLVLDHVIVQKMDDEEGGGDVRSILTYGAQALFDETVASRDITYTDQDLDKLIEKTEVEGEQVEDASEEAGHTFSFAKVWTAENDTLEEMDDQAHGHTGPIDSWAHTLDLILKENVKMKAAERTGRGVRRKAAIAAGNQQKLDFLDTPVKDKPRGRKQKRSRSTLSDESDIYVNANLSQSENSSDGLANEVVREDIVEPGVTATSRPQVQTGLSETQGPPLLVSNVTAHPEETPLCAMCGNIHRGTCEMTERSENLVHYRQILFTDQTGESFEERRDAIAIIDYTLEKRGELHLIHNQPLRLIEKGKSGASVSAQGVNSDVRTVQSSDFRPKTSSNLQRGVVISNLPSSSTDRAGPPETSTLGSTSSKRSSDSQGSTKKRQKMSNYPGCPVCGGPHHLVKDCPVTAAGPKSIYAAILRLGSQPEQSATVAALRGVLEKQEKRTLGQIPNRAEPQSGFTSNRPN